MKAKVLALAMVAAALCGCARHYVLTMNNGARMTTTSKPRLEKGSYVFKDALGQQRSVPAGRVREVAPASMAQDDRARFNPSGSKQ